tara:strand:- start:5207 stop:6661 length:1455 start_codon:yes stop_codon:yes gene_type:complete
MNGVGGDAFAIFYDGASGDISAMNASGRAGALAKPAFFAAPDRDHIPATGALAVTVPGAVAGWIDAHERFGSKPFAELLEPAIHYARDGFPVSTRLRSDIEEQGGILNEAAQALYKPGGSPPPAGALLKNVPLASTLETIAREGKQGFYKGEIAQRLSAFLESEGGYLRAGDFASHESTWVEPLRGDYLGHTFLAMPPNSQGIAQLALMGMSKAHPIESLGHNTTEYIHTLIELKKLAFADRGRWVADPEHADIPVKELLDPTYLNERATLVDANRAAEEVAPGFGHEQTSSDGQGDDSGDTVFLTAVDQFGNAVSWIQSNFSFFGSGLLEPETGILLHNRGSGFTLDPGHPNQVAPRKRPYHTLTPLMALRDGRFAFTLGTPGGDGQTQSLLQITHNMLVFGMTPQQAIEAPRFRSWDGLNVSIENRVSADVFAELQALGHDILLVDGWTLTFGGAQMVHFDESNGTLTAASDPRREAYGLAY